jgi:tetratricopeptide (TPR) repeat protein
MEKTWRLLTNIIAAVLMGLVTACGSGSPGTGTVPPSLSPSLPADPATPGQSSWERHQEDGGRYFDQGMDCVDAEDETCALEAFENAIAEYSKAIELNPGAIKSYYNRGQAHKERGDIYFDRENSAYKTEYENARGNFSEVIEQQPEEQEMLVDALYHRGILYYQDASFAEAIADFDRAIELAPEDSELYLQRGDTYAEMGKTDLAIADFSKAIAMPPDNPEAYYLRARAYEDKGENALALADFEKVLELDKERGEVPVEVKEFAQKRVEELLQSVEKP